MWAEERFAIADSSIFQNSEISIHADSNAYNSSNPFCRFRNFYLIHFEGPNFEKLACVGKITPSSLFSEMFHEFSFGYLHISYIVGAVRY